MSAPALPDRPSPNTDAREGGIDMLVIHYTGMRSGAAAIARLCDPAARVSAHYVIEEDGALHRLVREQDRAWHAGVSEWGGRASLNDCSIGIELVNPGHEWGYRDFPEAQMQALETLATGIVGRWAIPPERVLGHADIAPRRKDDPGERFDWPRLARAGLAIWPEAAAETEPGRLLDMEGVIALNRAMATVGYDLAEFAPALTAFRRRFRPHALEGLPVMRDYLIAREVAARYPVATDPGEPVATPDGITRADG